MTLLTLTLSVSFPPPSGPSARHSHTVPDNDTRLDNAAHPTFRHADPDLASRFDAHVIGHPLLQLILESSDKLDGAYHT